LSNILAGDAFANSAKLPSQIAHGQKRLNLGNLKHHHMHLLEHAPRFEIEAIALLAEKLYGIRASATPLPSERDQNFLLVLETRENFVLKIANALEEYGLLDAQNKAMTHLATRVVFCPRIIPTLSGEHMVKIESTRGGATHFVRLVNYLPGIPLAEVSPHSPELLRDLGKKLGQLDRELAGFDHPAAHRDFHWDLANGLRVIREHGPLIADAQMRELVDQCGQDFERAVLPLLPKLRWSVIHGDANDYNVLVGEHSEHQNVVGVIDFGDMVHSYTVGDLAVAIAYVVLDRRVPIAAAAQVVAGYHEEYALIEDELDALYGLVLMRLCMSVCLAAYQQQQTPDNAYLEISQRSIRNILPRLVAIDWQTTATAFRGACGLTQRTYRKRATGSSRGQPEWGGTSVPLPDTPTKAETLAARKRLLGRNLSLAYKDPVKIVRSSMQYLYDEEGREYLDAYNNVAHVGHCHPRVVKAGQEQMALLNTNTRYLHDLINRYAEHLTGTLPAPLSVCFFVNSGSEANELALRLARAHTKARDLIVLDHAYHGNTTTLIDISPYKHDAPGGQGAPSWVHTAPLADEYRGKYRRPDPLIAEKYAQHVVDLIVQLRERGVALAGFIAESLPSVGGQIVFPTGYLGKVYEAVRGAGGVCIADEVQTGYGRIGKHFWGFESYGVRPDIVVLGKPIGNGHPIGAVITTPEIAASFDNGMEFFSTFGGNTVSCAIGLTVLEVVLEENLQRHALLVGEQMVRGLQRLMGDHEIIGDVRGSGMFLGVELVRSRDTLEPATAEADLVMNRMRDQGILLGTDGPFHNVIKIRPPMPFSTSDADRLIATLDKIIEKIPPTSETV
jgi:4-aminobutyrate aminotransferase-like enzyme/Ser/Thr protein kinase RdoA (MazF antagonist)